MNKPAYLQAKLNSMAVARRGHGEDLSLALVGSAAMLVWIGEAMGITPERLHAALDEALALNAEAMEGEAPKLTLVKEQP